MKKLLALILIAVLMFALAGFALASDLSAPTGIVAQEAAPFGFAPVAAIVVICYLLAAGLKATPMDNKWLPVMCGICGGVLGYVGMIIMPDFPAKDILTAIAIGIVSGLAATGTNQIIKQLAKSNE